MKRNVRMFMVTAVLALACLSGCSRSCSNEVNYADYITEKRQNIYLYEDDNISVKIYCSEKESPFCADGYIGEMCALTEIFVKLPKTYNEVNFSMEGFEAELSYSAVDKNYYASFSAEEFETDNIDITIEYGDNSYNYTVQSVRYSGVMSCEAALQCVIDYDAELFTQKTANGLFDGEIFIRLIYDEDCYYYVGVCGKDKKISAFLLDGVRGKIIATKELQG